MSSKTLHKNVCKMHTITYTFSIRNVEMAVTSTEHKQNSYVCGIYRQLSSHKAYRQRRGQMTCRDKCLKEISNEDRRSSEQCEETEHTESHTITRNTIEHLLHSISVPA